MEKSRAAHTIKTLLEELKKSTPKFKTGQIFETLKSIYPSNKIPKKKRNIVFENISFTKPLASSGKDKRNYLKENSPIAKFFRNVTKGDFLEVVKINGYYAKCKNLSLTEEIRNKFYSNEDDLVVINFSMIANGTIKQFKRKVDNYLKNSIIGG